MKNKLIAKRYTEAFLSLFESKDYARLLDDIAFLQKVFKESPEASAFLNLFIFPAKEREQLFSAILKDLAFSDSWMKLFNLLVAKQKFAILESLLNELEQDVMELKGTIKVNLRIAHELDDNNIQKIKKLLTKKYGREVILNFIEDKEIIGGFIAETEDEVIDGSVKNHLQQFHRFVMNDD